MRRIRATSWEQLDALPQGEWVEVVGGLDIEVIEGEGRPRSPRVVIPLDPAVARFIKPRAGEVLDVKLRGQDLELVRRRRKPSSRD